MSSAIRSTAKPVNESIAVSVRPPVLQRRCGCGASAGPEGTCAECAGKERLGGGSAVVLGRQSDGFEAEADRIADQVMAGFVPAVQRLEQEESVQRNAAGPAAPVSAAVSAAATSVAAGGSPLPPVERAFFEPRLGRDLGHVRLHTGPTAHAAAQAIHARAYTLRNHIAFAAGQYDQYSTEGRHLMAHELTHTLQQTDGSVIHRLPLDDPFLEDESEEDFAAGRRREDRRGQAPDLRGGTLTYRDSTELAHCMRVMGSDRVAAAECRNIVLGEPIPEFQHVPGISSPVPFRASVQGGVATHRLPNVTITILPDVHSNDPAMQNRAETTISPPPMPNGPYIDIQPRRGSPVTGFTVRQDLSQLTIQTTYGPGTSARVPSGYGIGTRAPGPGVTQPTLGSHEGSHGRDYLQFLSQNPYPAFRGAVGQSRATFIRHSNQYARQVRAYIRRMTRASEVATDCSGAVTIDDHNRANGRVTVMCRGVPRNP